MEGDPSSLADTSHLSPRFDPSELIKTFEELGLGFPSLCQLESLSFLSVRLVFRMSTSPHPLATTRRIARVCGFAFATCK